MQRPRFESYPKVLKTIGDHIRKWRIDKQLQQRVVAETLKVCEDSIVGWEARGTTPAIKQMPRTIGMLGYNPVYIDTSTLAGRISYYRILNGITQKELAKQIGINESTIFHYEKGTHKPLKRITKQLEAILNQSI